MHVYNNIFNIVLNKLNPINCRHNQVQLTFQHVFSIAMMQQNLTQKNNIEKQQYHLTIIILSVL